MRQTSIQIVASLLLILTSTHASNFLAPLSASEMEAAVSVLKKNGLLPAGAAIASMALLEPDKSEVADAPRVARVAIIDHASRRSTETIIDLTASSLRQNRLITNGQPLMTSGEWYATMDTVRANPAWQEAMRRRGITNFADVFIVAWAGGVEAAREVKAHRYSRVTTYYRGNQKNDQGPPIEGVEIVVDIDEQKVLQVIDTGVRTVPRESSDFFNPEVRGPARPALKPLSISQPEGPSFEARDFEVSWDRWRFAWSLNAREGLVLHKVRYLDGHRERSILHRASISEMLVPYGSPSQTWFWRNAVDEGEYGLGHSAYPLVPGQTAPSHASLFDVAACSDDGAVTNALKRVGIYERPNDSLWSHTSAAGDTIGRLSRDLVIFFVATVGNYDYRLSWIFHQDGVIEFEAGMTGILLMAGSDVETCSACRSGTVKPGRQPLSGDERYGTLVARNTIAVNHQHFLKLRLDFDVDGPRNSVKEINTQLIRGRRENPYRNAWEAVSTVFSRESESTRSLSPATHRHWAVFNPNFQTSLGHYPAYILEPGGNAVPLLDDRTPPRKLLGFVNHPFHTTRYHASELFAGGEYPNQVSRADNLETWTRDNESIHNEDVVIWYTLGMTHVPRPEEFPVMPTARTGFRLLPKAFFDRNPALDVPE